MNRNSATNRKPQKIQPLHPEFLDGMLRHRPGVGQQPLLCGLARAVPVPTVGEDNHIQVTLPQDPHRVRHVVPQIPGVRVEVHQHRARGGLLLLVRLGPHHPGVHLAVCSGDEFVIEHHAVLRGGPVHFGVLTPGVVHHAISVDDRLLLPPQGHHQHYNRGSQVPQHPLAPAPGGAAEELPVLVDGLADPLGPGPQSGLLLLLLRDLVQVERAQGHNLPVGEGDAIPILRLVKRGSTTNQAVELILACAHDFDCLAG
mmetsp:Transcript_83276/g.222637  ORF Transcript_83276/g.222637 Transcript_83276/m.222637 type:complete len:257 (+) Transcript_83276:443-1213(+)